MHPTLPLLVAVRLQILLVFSEVHPHVLMQMQSFVVAQQHVVLKQMCVGSCHWKMACSSFWWGGKHPYTTYTSGLLCTKHMQVQARQACQGSGQSFLGFLLACEHANRAQSACYEQDCQMACLHFPRAAVELFGSVLCKPSGLPGKKHLVHGYTLIICATLGCTWLVLW